MAKEKTTERKPGRPTGAKTEPRDIVPTTSTRCRKCDSTQRSKYTQVRSRKLIGTAPDGRPFNYVEWKRCRCKNCGQARIDQVFSLLDPA